MTLTLSPAPSVTTLAISPASSNASRVISPALNSAASATKNQTQQITSNPISFVGRTDLSSNNLYTKPLTISPPSALSATLNNAFGYGLPSSYSPWLLQGAQSPGYSGEAQAKTANESKDRGDGDTTVLNSTNGDTVSWMDQDGNMLSKELEQETAGGTSFGAAVNKLAGKALEGGSAPQETTLKGTDAVPDNLGSSQNPVAENIVFADTEHSDGNNFKNDGENVTKASNANNSSTFNQFSEFKDYLLKRGAEALKTGENLIVTIAAHGSPDGGVSVGGEHISKEELNELLDLAGVKVTVNCPCFSQLGA